MFRNALQLSPVQIVSRLGGIAVVGLLVAFSANDVQAQHHGRVTICQQNGTCVQPPRRDFCCQPKLGFYGEMNCHGLLILDVYRGSLACRAGLERGDVILKVNHHPFRSFYGFKALLHESLINHGGHTDLLVKKPCGRIVVLHVDLVHTCRRGEGF